MALNSSTRTELAPDGMVVKHGSARVHTSLASAPERHAFELAWQDRQMTANLEE